MTLDELKATAPRSFDKTLVDLMVAIQAGGQPIAVPHAPAPNDEARAIVQAAILERLEAQDREIERLRALLCALAEEAQNDADQAV